MTATPTACPICNNTLSISDLTPTIKGFIVDLICINNQTHHKYVYKVCYQKFPEELPLTCEYMFVAIPIKHIVFNDQFIAYRWIKNVGYSIFSLKETTWEEKPLSHGNDFIPANIILDLLNKYKKLMVFT